MGCCMLTPSFLCHPSSLLPVFASASQPQPTPNSFPLHFLLSSSSSCITLIHQPATHLADWMDFFDVHLPREGQGGEYVRDILLFFIHETTN